MTGHATCRRASWLLLGAAALVSCAPAPRPNVVPVYAQRLVLALDGVDYRDIVSARERGLFAAFRPPSRLISTFPSISDIAWHEIFGVLPPRGYQRVYYSHSYNAVIGGPIDAIRPIEFEERMDMAFGGKFHHLSAYIASSTVARGEIDQVVQKFFGIRGRRTVYVYNVGPDALQHTRGDLTGYLRHLDLKLNQLRERYAERTGRELEIVLLSDHGHNKVANARFIPVADALRERGFRMARQRSAPTDVAFSVDGVTTGFGVFSHPDSVEAVARLLAAVDGVELVSATTLDGQYRIRNASVSAYIDHMVDGEAERFRYDATPGDPLGYAGVVAQMRADAVLDAAGFADAATWTRYTSTHEYPAAVERIVRGHSSVALNQAPILASIRDGFHVGLGAVSVANRLRPLGGTHGGLGSSSSLGVVMTNFIDTHDDLTTRVRGQFGGFDDLLDPYRGRSGARISSTSLMQLDRFSAFRGMADSVPALVESRGLEVWLGDGDVAWGRDGLVFLVELTKRDQNREREVVVVASTSSDSEWYSSASRRRFFAPLELLRLSELEPGTSYTIRIGLTRRADATSAMKRARPRMLTPLSVRSDRAGELHPY
jgi:hypothetical protein